MAGVTVPSAIPEVDPFGDFNSFINAVKGVTGTNQTGTSTTDIGGTAQDAVNRFLQYALPSFNEDYSKEAAIRDSQGLVDQIFQNYKEGDLPKIYTAEKNTGGYNSTTGQLLANDAFARATAKGAQTQSDTISRYATLGQSRLAQLLTLALGLANVNRTTSSQSNTGGMNSSDLRKAAAAAALAAAARKPTLNRNSAPQGQPAGRQQDQNQSADPAADAVNNQLSQQEPYDAPTNDTSGEAITQEILDSAGATPTVTVTDNGPVTDQNLPIDLPSDLIDTGLGDNGNAFDSLDAAGGIGDLSNLDFGDLFSQMDYGDLGSGDSADFNFDFGGGIDFFGGDSSES